MNKTNKVLSLGTKLLMFTLLFAMTGSVALAAALGVSGSTAARIISAAYKAYKAGKSVKNAVAAFTGWGALLWIAIDFLIGFGISKAMNSTWAQSA